MLLFLLFLSDLGRETQLYIFLTTPNTSYYYTSGSKALAQAPRYLIPQAMLPATASILMG
jgi:hypothetical protein